MVLRGCLSLAKRVVPALMLCGLTLSLLAPAWTSAAEPQAGGQGIQISPVLIDLNAEKGKIYTLKLTVTNVTAGSLVLKANAVDFKAKDELGTPEFLTNDSEQSNAYSFKDWVSPLSSIYLRSKESRQVSVQVQVPANAEAGGHYGVIRFSGVPPELSGQNVALTASVGVLVLTRVEGAITEQLSLKQLFTEQKGHPKGVLETGPVDIVTRLENTGNVHVKPSGTITIKNFFGSTIATLPLTDQPKNVLPGSIRRLTQTLHNKWLFGRYSVALSASYGATGKTLSGSTSFWVLPYKVILICVALLALAIWLVRRSIKRYNAKVIKRHLTKKTR